MEMDRTFVVTGTLVAICICALITTVGHVNISKQKAMAEMVAKGANPIAVHCAMDGVNTSNQAVCQSIAAQAATIANNSQGK